MPRERAGTPRSWWIEVKPHLVENELTWLAELYQVHGHVLDPDQLPLREMTARERYRAEALDTR